MSSRNVSRALAACALLVLLGSAAAASGPRRVVVVSFDGAGGFELRRRVAEGILGPDGFRRALAEGFSAERLAVVTPSATSVSHASISTGAYPARHGIVANTFHRAGDPITSESRGFHVEPAVEAIWEAAARQGKRVASIAWPGLSQRTPRTTCAVALEFGEPIRGAVWHAEPGSPLADAAFALPAGIVSFSPPRSLPAPLLGDDGRLVLVDTEDDGRRGYDTLVAVGMDGALLARGRAGAWMPVAVRRDDGEVKGALFGRWLKLVTLAPDLSKVALYVGPRDRTRARPDDFRRTVERRAGFWPGSPDPALLALGDTESFLEQATRLSEYLGEAFRIADRRGDWDLLLGYDPVLDDTEHPLFLVDPRQPQGTAERRAAAAAALKQAWRIADRAAANYLSFASRGDVLLVSDHGTRPAFRAFHLLEAMRREGWVKARTLDGKTKPGPDSPATALVAGSFGFVVVNREGKVPGGVVPEREADALVRRIAAHMRGLKDETGHPLFTIVATPAEAHELGLDTPNAGDLVLAARSGVTLKLDFPGADAALLGPADQPGQHGAEPDPQLDGIFAHVGDGILRERVDVFRALDVARTVSSRLGIEPPGTSP